MVITNMVGSLIMLDDMFNPHIPGGHTWKGTLAMCCYFISAVIMLMLNGVCFYICTFYQLFGELSFDA